MNVKPTYPSAEHDRAARAVVDFLSGQVVDAAFLRVPVHAGKPAEIAVSISPSSSHPRTSIVISLQSVVKWW